MEETLTLYTSSPCTTDGVDGHWSGQWMVWDMYEDLPPKPIFVGTMEEAGGVTDVMNARLRRTPPHPIKDTNK
jgi:hypothetical protein